MRSWSRAWRMTGSAPRLEESRDGRLFAQRDDGKRAKTRRVARWTLVRARREIFINWGSAEGEGDGIAPRFQAMRIPQNGRFA